MLHHLEEFTATQHQSEPDQRPTAGGNNFLVSACHDSEMQFLYKSQTYWIRKFIKLLLSISHHDAQDEFQRFSAFRMG